jgi:hypothetical protein
MSYHPENIDKLLSQKYLRLLKYLKLKLKYIYNKIEFLYIIFLK